MEYNFLDNTFTIYKSVPKVELQNPITLEFTDISDIADSITPEGVPIMKNAKKDSKLTINTKYVEHPTTTFKANADSSDKKSAAFLFFQLKGLTPNLAAGIVGNLIVESRLDSGIKGDGGKAFGLAQWHPDRLKGLKALAQSRGKDISDFETLLEYVWQELNTTEKKALNKLTDTNTVEDATKAFMKHFERPGIENLENRIRHAKSLL